MGGGDTIVLRCQEINPGPYTCKASILKNVKSHPKVKESHRAVRSVGCVAFQKQARSQTNLSLKAPCRWTDILPGNSRP